MNKIVNSASTTGTPTGRAEQPPALVLTVTFLRALPAPGDQSSRCAGPADTGRAEDAY